MVALNSYPEIMFSEPAIAPQSHRIRFRLAGGAQPLMLVPANVNGRGPHEFIIVGDFLEMLSTVIGVKLDRIIGYNFLKLYKVVIDYPNETLALLPP